MKPLITIAVAVYNIEEKFLRKCLESVVKNPCEEIEILIVDDCSQNGAYEICAEYAEKDPRIVLVRNGRNGGIGYVRNVMIEKARGEWIYFVDGDDAIDMSFAEYAGRFCESDFDVLIYDYKTFEHEVVFDKNDYDGGYVELSRETVEDYAINCLTEAPCTICQKGVSIGCTAKGFRRSMLLEHGIKFIEDLKISEDALFVADVLQACKKAAYCPFMMYYYRVGNRRSVTNAYNSGMEQIRNRYLAYSGEKLEKYFAGREDVGRKYMTYKIPSLVFREFKLNIFHKDNPRGYAHRKREFVIFLGQEPYRTAMDNIDLSKYKWRERALILKLAKKRCFFLLNFMFRHRLSFAIYGGVSNRLDKLKKGLKIWKRH